MSAWIQEHPSYVFEGLECRIGDRMTTFQLDVLPVGSVVQPPEGEAYRYTKMVMGPSDHEPYSWRKAGAVRNSRLGNRINDLISVPIETEAKAPVVDRPETVARYRRRFAAFVLTKVAELSEVHQESARTVLTDLGLLAEGVQVGDELTADSEPPEGTVATHGAPDQAAFSVFKFADGRWGWVSGPVGNITKARVVTVCYVPNDPFAEVGGDQSAMIADFHAWVWAKAQELKPQYKWCSALERILEEFGIPNPDVLPDLASWPTIIGDRDARAELPIGAVLGASNGDWGVFVKVGEDDKLGRGWRTICGNRPKARGPMHLMSNTNEVRHIGPLLDFLPVGSRVLRGGGRAPYVKESDGAWSREEDGYHRSAKSLRTNATLTWVI